MGKSFAPLFALFLVFLAVGPTIFPNFFWHIIMTVDHLSPTWKMFDDIYVQKYHDYLMSRLPDRPAGTPIVLQPEDVTHDSLYKISQGYTVPVIIKGAIKDAPAVKLWANKTWWIENYGDEEVLCKYLEAVKGGDDPACTIKDAFGSVDGENKLYITGDSKIFLRHPELAEMINTPFLEEINPGKHVFSQLFLGFPGMGSDIHSAMGTNVFRMISGRKKWWLIPQSQSAYVFGSLNPNGFSAHSKTVIGKGKDTPSPWLSKIERYEITLEPGDVLLNTAWYWHGILNMAPADYENNPDEMVLGVPTRYAVDYSLPALKSNPLLTLFGISAIRKQTGTLDSFTSNAKHLQDGIERARIARATQTLGKM